MGDSLTGDRSLGEKRAWNWAWNSRATLLCPYLAKLDHQTTFGGLEPYIRTELTLLESFLSLLY